MSAQLPIVLVHGAFQTAATWDLLVPRLTSAGRRVVVAALTGLEGDQRDLTDAVALDTHIRDVVALLTREDLTGVILVGHSYACFLNQLRQFASRRVQHANQDARVGVECVVGTRPRSPMA